MQDNMTRRRLIISNSVYSLIMGIAINSIVPIFSSSPIYPVVAFLFNAVGIGGISYYATTWSRFDLVFQNLKLGAGILYPILKSKRKGIHSTTYKFTLPPGLCVDDFVKHQVAIEEHIGRKMRFDYLNKGLFTVEVYHNSSQQFYDYSPIKLKGNIPIMIGRDIKGSLVSFDLGSGTEPHMLIAGSSGCGKSNILRSIITNLILFSEVNLYLVDLKHGAEFSVFKKSSKVKGFAADTGEALDLLKDLLAEIQRRYKLFAKNNLNDIHAYNRKYPHDKLPFELLVIDEMIDFKTNKDLLRCLEVISAKARACGIHAILSTQRPDKDIIEGAIKSNVTNILGLKTNNGINSRIIIDDLGLEDLKGMGHGLLVRVGTTTEVQTPYITTEMSTELIRHTYIDKTVQKEKSNVITVDFADLEVFTCK